MFGIGLFIGLTVGIIMGLFIHAVVESPRKIKVGIPSTSTNSQNMPFQTGYGDGNYNGFGV